MRTSRWNHAVRFTAALAALAIGAFPAALADAHVEEHTTFEMSGMIGSMMKRFGGDAAREGLTTTVYVKGDRMLRRTGNSGQLIDLAEKKVYQLDFDREEYSVMSFDQMRQQMEQAMHEAPEGGNGAGGEPGDEDAQGVEYDVTFDIEKTGQTRTIQGYECRNVVVTIKATPKGQTLEQGGGVVITANNWLASGVDPLDERAGFERRFAEALGLEELMQQRSEQMASAMSMYPGIGDALSKLQEEQETLAGAPMLTEMTIDSVGGQAAAESGDRPSVRKSLKKLGGLFGRKKNDQDEASDQPATGGPGERKTVVTTRNEITAASGDVPAGALEIPAGFRAR